MDWIPIGLVAFKLVVFGTGMFFAIKWHYDQGKKKEAEEASRSADQTRQAKHS
jgi:cbb3-type cytochrome oxidase subunit 3